MPPILFPALKTLTPGKPKGVGGEPWVAPSTVRLAFSGLSIMDGWISSGSGLEAALNAAYPETTWTVLDWTRPGSGDDVDDTYNQFVTNIESISSADPFDQTYFITRAGLSSSLNPYSTATPAELAKYDQLADFRTKILAEGFPESSHYLLELAFYIVNAQLAYYDEDYSSVPFTENHYHPEMTSVMRHADGTPYFDWYTLIYNGYPESMADQVHPSAQGYADLQQHFIDTVARYIMTGQSPAQLRQDLFTDAAPVPTGLAGTPGNGEVDLTWNHQKITRFYRIYRDNVLVHTTPNNVPFDDYTDTGLTNGVQYSYEISAVNDAGESARSAPILVTPEVPANLTTFIIHGSGSATDPGLNRFGSTDPATAPFNSVVDTDNVTIPGVTARIVAYGAGQKGTTGNFGPSSGTTSNVDLTNDNVQGNSTFAQNGPVTAEIRGLPANTTVNLKFVAVRTGTTARYIDVAVNGVSKLTQYDVTRDPAVIESGFTGVTDSNGDLDIEATKGLIGGNNTFTYISGIEISY